MTLTADSGSTKTAWFIDGQHFETQGLNPLTTPDGEIRITLHDVALRIGTNKPDHVCFYGAGCGTAGMREKMAALLCEALPSATVKVGTDMLGACRGSGENGAGLTAILGTGSNVCYYDGNDILAQQLSLGYLLGDEGSGNHLGRLMLKDCLEGSMPTALAIQFAKAYNISHQTAIERLYQQPNPNRWLASLAPFASANISVPYIAELVAHCMDAFMTHMVKPLSRNALQNGWPEADTLRVVGSVAVAFAAQLKTAASNHGITITAIQKSPQFR